MLKPVKLLRRKALPDSLWTARNGSYRTQPDPACAGQQFISVCSVSRSAV